MMLIATLLSCTGTIPVSTGKYWGIRDQTLPYIARIRAERNNAPAVIYNPVICDQIGAACGFFYKHAFSHYFLNHQLLEPKYYTQLQEDQADCYAAKTAKSEDVFAAVMLMESDEASNYPITGDPKKRARLVRECAVKYNNWAGLDR